MNVRASATAATSPTLLIAAGGTGGHIMPGLAVAAAWRAGGGQVLWCGHPERMEGRLVPPAGIDLLPLRFAGLRGKGVWALLKLPFVLLAACIQAWCVLTRARADVLLGLGGYVAFPVGLIAALRRVPLVVHEQNAIAGLTNRVLARLARQRLAGFPGALKGALVTGNPVRAELSALAAPEERYRARTGRLRVLVVGGSLGAQAFNTVVPAALARLPVQARPLVRHQCGQGQEEAVRAAYAASGRVSDTADGIAADGAPLVQAFIDDMAAAYAWADVLICRAGAMTVAEVAGAGLAALFVPYPHAVDDHQCANARALADVEAAWLCRQADFTADWLADWLAGLTREAACALAVRARAQATPAASAQIVAACLALCPTAPALALTPGNPS